MSDPDVAEGVITRIEDGEEENTIVAWGELDDDTTFDIPLPKDCHFVVGNKVMVRKSGGSTPIDHDLCYIAFGDHYAAVLYCEQDENGSFAIAHHQIIAKAPH